MSSEGKANIIMEIFNRQNPESLSKRNKSLITDEQ